VADAGLDRPRDRQNVRHHHHRRRRHLAIRRRHWPTRDRWPLALALALALALWALPAFLLRLRRRYSHCCSQAQ